jgi:poly(3-hydroxybutyrate) depolymerase
VRELPGALSVLFFSVGVAAAISGSCSQSRSGSADGHDAASSAGAAMGGNSGLGGASQTSGRAGSGAAPGSGGASAAGGSSGSGGTTATGGTVSAGGATSAGGNTSGGGATRAGGVTSVGGTSSAGGTTGHGGNADADAPVKDAASARTDGADAGVLSRDAAASDSAPQTCPAGQNPPTAGNNKASLQHGGKSRSYILHVPSGLTAGKPLALVFDLHGAGGNGSQQQGMSGWGSVADKEKFLVVYPDGIGGYWNVDDKCCGTAGEQKIDDVGFIKAIVDKLSADTCIDARRIYVTGFSNGGGLAHRMGCDAADVIAAIAPTATDLRTQPCNAARPISMMEVKGMADSLEPYDGGMVGPAGGQYLAVGAKASQKLWADIDKCTGTTTTIDQYCESYTQCADVSLPRFRGHVVYAASAPSRRSASTSFGVL